MTVEVDLSGTVVPPKDFAAWEAGLNSSTNIPSLLSNPLELSLKLNGDLRGITLSNLDVSTRTSIVAVARGFAPVTINPGEASNWFRLDPEGPLALTASTRPHSFFWGKVADWTGLVLREPKLEAEVSGTWNAPQGEARLTVTQVTLPKVRATSVASLENFRLNLQLNRDRAQIVDCQMRFQGQPVTLTGSVPLGEGFWRGLRDKQIPNYEQASVRLSMENADVSAFEPLLPEIVAPAGKLDLEISLRPGGNLAGGLKLSGARMRPLPGIGAVRDISVEVSFVDRDAKLVRATGQIGGAFINVTGQADLRGTNWLKNWSPPFEVALKGTNLPLSRQPDSIVRSDFDLTIRKTNDATPVISGKANLRNSFYLSDLADLMPGQVASPEQRPPFFSIREQPLANWRLDVRVTGSRWLRVRSTLFNGEVSANLRILGTLAEPFALGDARIDSGTVRFPFATLKVQQGFVTLGSQDPYHPQLQVTASSKEYGYDINLQITGPADSPIVQFTSVPPLSSEQIVLLVTAGTVPTQERLSTQQRAGTVAVFLGRDLLSRLGFSDTGESRLNIHSGQDVTEEGRPTYNVEYRLSDRWSLVGEYDRFNAFNAGFKWRIYSK
jgi:translocation and assembly module TamB